MASRAQERRLWQTLWYVGAVLTLVLATSIMVAAGAPGAAVTDWFYVQQSVLLALSAVGTFLAVRRWRALRG
ncbi:hypothetical protein IWX63_001567 [Arthrobacter sp. CAN_A2]|uniref:hypothetical protein n=1 Tax=Arthrobacter sp. CAN_A2 TaxID=2787718 RepID=UPI0018EFAB4F